MRKKQIAVFMCAITNPNQRKLFDGMIEAAKEADCNLYDFGNYLSNYENMKSIQGAYHVLTLPDLSEFDGVILAANTIHYPPVMESILNQIKEKNVPAVSIDNEMPGMSTVGISSYEAEFELVEHFIVEHGCREIYYISGALQHKEGKKRYQAYCDALEKHGIEYDEDKVHFGIFDLTSGRQAAEKFLENGSCPKAVISGNDDMALGAIEIFRERGYRIPEDIKIAGFDNSELSVMHDPPLTSVKKNQHEVGYKAVYEVLNLINGAEPSVQRAMCTPVIRKTCGCDKGEFMGYNLIKEKYVNDRIQSQGIADTMRNMFLEHASMEDPEELIDSMKKYLLRIGMESFYLCLCEKDKLFVKPEDNLSGNLDIDQINTEYTDEITIPLAYEKGEHKSYGPFPKGKVLPDECKDESGGNYFIVLPINYERLCYGYCVVKNHKFPFDNALFHAWTMAIGISLENIRKRMLLKDTVITLNGVWAYDMLTRLYNRAGFFHYSKNFVLEMKEKNKDIFLLFMDMDGLKAANDTLGHEIGDWMIREMAEVIKQNLLEGQMAMRYGGDEFVILGCADDKEALEKLPERLRATMDSRTQINSNLFELKASMGIITYAARDIKSLDVLIEEADKNMYIEKRERKARMKAEAEAAAAKEAKN